MKSQADFIPYHPINHRGYSGDLRVRCAIQGLKARGLDSATFAGAVNLARALQVALDNPEAAQQWLDGDSVFQNCPNYSEELNYSEEG